MMTKSAIFSNCRRFRYSLERIWSTSKPFVLFVCLNPSTADENVDDPTIRRCVGYADSWGYGGLVVCNLFAYRSTDPKVLSRALDPIGPDNDKYLSLNSALADKTILAWGTNARADRVVTASKMLTRKHYLKLTKNGCPSHPLYLKKTLTPIKWTS